MLKPCQYTYNIFGSKDSIDIDVMVFVDKLPNTTEECKDACHKYEKELDLGDFSNVNLAVVKDGIVTECFKGTPDEVNNSILATYGLHDKYQEFDCQVDRPVERDIPLKIARCFRIILTLISRTQYRAEVKKALKGDVEEKIEFLQYLDFTTIDSFNKNGLTDIDCWKAIVFQIIQTIFLIDNIEIYTKGEAKAVSPPLTPVIMRENISEEHKLMINSIMDLLFLRIFDKCYTEDIKEIGNV